MQATMQETVSTVTIPAARRWTGRVLSGFAGLFLIFDGMIKVLRMAPAVDGTVQLGYPVEVTPILGIILLACLAIYALPRTAVLGAILLTGYLGGVIATHLRVGSPAFSFIFVFILAALVWGGLALRDRRIVALLGAAR